MENNRKVPTADEYDKALYYFWKKFKDWDNAYLIGLASDIIGAVSTRKELDNDQPS